MSRNQAPAGFHLPECNGSLGIDMIGC